MSISVFALGWALFSTVLLTWVIWGPTDAFRKFVKQRDSSDPAEGRSHMKVMTDHGTGREYLACVGMFGVVSAITPRLPAIDPVFADSPDDRADRIWKQAVSVWKSDLDAELFLTRAHPLLENRFPIDVARSSAAGLIRVQHVLGRLENGVAP